MFCQNLHHMTSPPQKQEVIDISERKKLRTEIAKQFPCVPEVQLPEIIPAKEEMSIMKIYTHSGESVLVYCLLKNPIFFEVDKAVYPTVYTLWKFPELLTVFTTWPPVFSKMAAGADLMLPGVVVAGPINLYTFSNINKGHPSSVKLMGNKAPVAVGRTAMSGTDMYESAMRGKGVLILHTYKDLLWAHGDKQDVPLIDDSAWIVAVTKSENSENEGNCRNTDQQVDGMDTNCDNLISNTDSGKYDSENSDKLFSNTISSEYGDNCINKGVDNINLEDNGTIEGACGYNNENEEREDTDSEEDDGLTPQERMDNLLYDCFLCAIKSSVKKSDLPLLTSSFFKTHMQKYSPADKTIDVKKSSHKKLGKFLQAMQQKGFIKMKELTKGVDSIIELHKDHLDLRGFIVPEVVARQDTPPASDTDYRPPEIIELYSVTAAVLNFFRETNKTYSKGTSLTIPEIRKCITDYVKANELQDKSQITIDVVLSPIVLQKGEYRETMRWDELLTRFFQKMSPAYQFTIPGQQPVVKKGKLEPVTLKVATRSGNKKVSLVYNLELFGIDLHEFAHTVQKGVACSTSITPLPGKAGGMEVLVQGNQINFIAQLLFDKYKLPKKFLQGLDLAPKSGKKKR